MTQKPPSMFKASLKLAWPISLQNLLVTMLGMIDVMMVSHLGNASVAAVGLGNRVQFVVLVIIQGLAWGVGILSAQYYGAGKSNKIRRSILMGVTLGCLVLTPIVIMSFYFADTVMGWGSADPELIAIGESYLWITMPSLLFVSAIMVLENALRGTGQVKLPMVLGSIAILLNVVLNYWLINGGLGIEPLGVDGAAIATTVSRFMHLIIMVSVLTIARHKIKPSRIDVKSLREFQPWKKLIKLVIPLMFGFGVWSIGTFVYQLIYGQLGTQELAVISLLVPVEGMFVSLFFGFASACSIMVGQRLGANKFDEAWQVGKIFARTAPVVAMVLGVVLLLSESIVFIPFNDLPPATLAMASDVFLIIALGACIKITNMTLAMGILRAGGENKACLYIDIFGMWMVSIPATMLAAFYFNLPMFWVVFTAYSEEIVKLVLFSWRANQKKWLRNLTL
ncbi:MATE family efflux transporter [Colwelliaceae bacterium BS250]